MSVQKLTTIVNTLNSQSDILIDKIQDSYELEEIMKTKNPTAMRRIYETKFGEFDSAEQRYISMLEKINEVTASLDTVKIWVERHIDIIRDMKKIMNIHKVGTLEGLARQAMEENSIVPAKDDEIANAVLQQPYRENAQLNLRGGKKKQKNIRTRKNRRR